MNIILKEKAIVIIELCSKISENLLFYIADGDEFKEYDIPVYDDFIIFNTSVNYCECRQQLIYENNSIDIRIIKYKKLGHSEYNINYKCDNKTINIDDKVLSTIFSKTIEKLKECYIEYEKRETPKETIRIIENLCKENVRILLHGTDYARVESILNQGLKIWDLGLSCRTTVMVDNNTEKILSYRYSSDPKPRNIIIVIPEELIDDKIHNSLDGSDMFCCMFKCIECTAGFKNGYNNWCYFENYIYELIVRKTDIGWVIPPEFIYGYVDYNGNITLNKSYLPIIQDSDNKKILKQKLGLLY